VSFDPAVGRELDRYLRESRIAANAEAPLFPTRTGDPFDEDGFAKLFARLRERSGIRTSSAHILRHTWATNFMSVPGANLLELKRQGGWGRWEMVERYSHRVPVRDRLAIPNPLDPSPQNRLWSAALRDSQPPFAIGVENERRARAARRH
jgi:integrase